jgi:DNA-binding response OmpR family regulator
LSDVVLVRWPAERAEGERLVAAGAAVLYLVDEGEAPPVVSTCLEDWVRSPREDEDLVARVAALERRLAAHDAPPGVDAAARLRYRGRVLPLPPAEAELARLLTERFGEAVADGELRAALVESASGGVPSLRAHMSKLRALVREVGLSVQRVRRRGYRLQRR